MGHLDLATFDLGSVIKKERDTRRSLIQLAVFAAGILLVVAVSSLLEPAGIG